MPIGTKNGLKIPKDHFLCKIGNMADYVQKHFGHFPKILDMFPKKIKNLFHGILDIIQRYNWTKFQLPSLIFEKKVYLFDFEKIAFL